MCTHVRKMFFFRLFVCCSSFLTFYRLHIRFSIAQTGSGKTLAFVLPIVERLALTPNSKHGRAARVLVMAPTRELAKQTSDEFNYVAPALVTSCIYGGVSYDGQERDLRSGLDVIVGTPGRIIDHLQRGTLRLDNVEFVVLDEADRMLDMGFAEDMETILKRIPAERKHQTLLFSATFPQWVAKVARQYLSRDHVTVDLIGQKGGMTEANTLIQHLAILCHWKIRSATLADVVKVYGGNGRTIVFADTKNEATQLATTSSINDMCGVLHGDISQQQREITLDGFRNGKFNVLVATDVAARGLDIPEVQLVIQCQPPKDKESFIHRVGRTGRAGRAGVAIMFFQNSQVRELRMLERQVGIEFKRIGTPQIDDIVMAAARNVGDLLEKVHPDMIKKFVPVAQQIADKSSAVEALGRIEKKKKHERKTTR
jgi:ATP-dependent RNA helicase DDX21